MRKLLSLLTLLVVVIACQKDIPQNNEVVDPSNGDNLFKFTAKGEEVSTRALDNTLLNSFAVYTAMTYDRDLENAGNANPSVDYDAATHYFNWMYNAHIKKNGSDWEYVAANSGVTEHYYDYWKYNANHSFFAISPYDAVKGNSASQLYPATVTPEMGIAGDLSFEYAVPRELVAQGNDLMVASKLDIGGQDINSNFNETVNLKFKHTLAQVSFSVRLNDAGIKNLTAVNSLDGSLLFPDAKIKVHSLGFLNVSASGKLTFDSNAASVPTGEIYKEAPFSWTPNNENATIQWNDNEITRLKKEFIGSSAFTVADADEVHLGDKGSINVVPTTLVEGGPQHIALMIPQKFDADAKLVLSYTQNLKDLSGGDLGESLDIVKEISVYLNNAVSGAPVITEIEAGKRYHFDITFDFAAGVPTMHVKASIYDWNEEVVDGDIEGGVFTLVNNSRVYNLPEKETTLEIPFTTTYLEDDFKDAVTGNWNISCEKGGSAVIDYAGKKIIYTAPAAGLVNNHDVITFTVRGRTFELDVFNGTFSFGDQTKFTIPEGQDDIVVSYNTSYDHNLLAPEVLNRLYDVQTQNGGTVDITFDGVGGFDGSVKYTKPVDADARGIYSDIVTANVAGKTYSVEIYWGYFRLDAVSDIASLNVTMDPFSNTVEIPYYSNYNAFEIAATNTNLDKGRVTVTTNAAGNRVINYTSTALDISQDVISVKVADKSYSIVINMSSLFLDEGGLKEFVGTKDTDPANLYGYINSTRFITSYTNDEVIAASKNTENRNATVSVLNFVNGSPNKGVLYYKSTSKGGSEADRVTITIAERELLYTIITK